MDKARSPRAAREELPIQARSVPRRIHLGLLSSDLEDRYANRRGVGRPNQALLEAYGSRGRERGAAAGWRMNPRPDGPITAGEVARWFEAAKVKGATPEAAEFFAVLVERWRGPKDRDAHADERAMIELFNASHRFLNELLALPPYLKRLPEVRALALALKPVVAFPAGKRGRPTSGATHAAKRFMDALATSC